MLHVLQIIKKLSSNQIFENYTWQGKGLGALLTDYCLEIARDIGVQQLTAEATADNERAINLFARRGFTIDPAGDNIVLARKVLD